MKVTIFSTSTCPYCRMLKEYLTGKQIAYEEKLVDQDPVAQQEMIKHSGGFLGVPFTVVTPDYGSPQTVVGFDKNKLDSILNISK